MGSKECEEELIFRVCVLWFEKQWAVYWALTELYRGHDAPRQPTYRTSHTQALSEKGSEEV